MLNISTERRFYSGWRRGGRHKIQATKLFLCCNNLLCKFFFALSILCLTKSANAQSQAEQVFKEFLSGKVPIKSLRFTEITCQTGNQRHYFAAIDTNGFFLKEYNLTSDPTAPISLDNLPQNSNFYGRNRKCCWNIDGALEINESSDSDRVVNACQLGVKDAKNTLDTILNLGMAGRSIKQGSFVWSGTNGLYFTAQIADGVTFTRRKNGVDTKMTNIAGCIILTNGYVSRITSSITIINYEYATNSQIPNYIPSKIIIGKSNIHNKIYLIDELKYGHVDNFKSPFDPENQFAATNIATVFFITNGERRTLYNPHPQLPRQAAARTQQNNKIAVRLFVIGILLSTPLVFFLIVRATRKGNK